ncbi:hypothetical protein K438DRAFT_1980150 [Mycena galopus ATCC 62051]|nr:hypothetical protein K438DRAFT_1980150 [Mycena galopus ATCC 62051]
MSSPNQAPYSPQPNLAVFPALHLYPIDNSFVPKRRVVLGGGQRVKIGCRTSTKTQPGEKNGYFASWMLSRQHAEVWEEGGRIFIKDVKSKNGTFINGKRLSLEGRESEPSELKSDDILQFGVNIFARVACVFIGEGGNPRRCPCGQIPKLEEEKHQRTLDQGNTTCPYVMWSAGPAARASGHWPTAGHLRSPATVIYAGIYLAFCAAPPRTHTRDLQNFLQRPASYAIIPLPLPQEYTSDANEFGLQYPGTHGSHECNLYDVPRAKGIFACLLVQAAVWRMQCSRRTSNDFAERAGLHRWLVDATIEPTTRTFALMFLAMHRFPEHIPQTGPLRGTRLARQAQFMGGHLTRMRAYNQSKAANHSHLCSVNYKIEISCSFLHDTFYLPHSVDLRARAKSLGARGFRWLKMHLSNLYDKTNFDERAAFTDTHLEDIYDSARVVYSAIESGDPEAYECSLPVHQDGTCNGLQHYAALGADHQGAQQVNLSARERPSDVYSFVGGMVERMLDEDAANGDWFAIMLKGKVSRKVVKQTVMTTVYGLTFVGTRDQIEKQGPPEEECWLAASYLAKRVLSAIGDLFTGATKIRTWLNLCARLIAKSILQDRIDEAQTEPFYPTKKEQMTSVVWTTPLGLPICQPYRKTARKQVFTKMQTVYISDPASPTEGARVPPYFLCLVADRFWMRHMMLTAIECRVQGLTFASVHDSYWTHARSIDHMSKIIRDTFIALHSSDVLKKLEAEFKKRYQGFKVPLLHLRSGRLKKLADVGSRIKVTPEQTLELPGLKELLEIDSESAVVEVEATDKYDALEGLLGQFDAEANAR